MSAIASGNADEDLPVGNVLTAGVRQPGIINLSGVFRVTWRQPAFGTTEMTVKAKAGRSTQIMALPSEQ
jgi:hypothetical protein